MPPRDLINIQLGQGVDTKTDPKAVDLGDLLSSQNVDFSTLRSLKKRNGNLLLPHLTTGGGTVFDGFTGLATLNGQLLAQGGDSELYGVDIIGNAVRPIGTIQPMTISTETIQSLPTDDLIMSATASAVVASPSTSLPMPQGIQVTAWEASSGGCYYQVADLYSGDLIVNPTALLNPAYASPRALTVGNKVVMLFINGTTGNIEYRSVSASAPTTIASGSTGATVDRASGSPYVNAIYDVAYDAADGYLWFVTKAFGTTVPQVTAINASTFATVHAQGNCPGITDALLSPPSISIFWGAPGNLYVFTVGQTGANTQRVNWTVLSSSAASVASGTSGTTPSVGTNGAGPMTTATGLSGGTPGYQVLVQTADSTTPLKIVQWQFIPNGSSSTMTATPVATTLGMHLVSTFQGPNISNVPISFGVVAWESPQQATYFIVDQTLRIHGKFLAGTAGSAPDTVRNRLTDLSLSALADGSFDVALSVQAQISAVSGQIITRNGVQFCSVDLSPAPSMLGAQLGGDLHLTGGQLWDFDGRNLVEHGFPVFPEWIPASGSQFDAPAFNIIQTQPAVGNAGTSITQVTCPPASQIINGSFLQLGTARTSPGAYLIFGVDGASPSLPFAKGTNNQAIVVPLLHSDTSAVVAQKCYTALTSHGFIGSTLGTPSLIISQSSFLLTETVSVGTTLLDLSRNSQEFIIVQQVPGTGGTKQIVTLLCPAAKYLAASQYFVIQGNTLLSGSPTSIAVWFKIAGVGTVPSIGVNGGTLQVTLAGTEEGDAVGTAIITAINAAVGVQAIFTAATNGANWASNEVALVDVLNGNTAIGGYNVSAGGGLSRTAGTPTAGVYGYAFTYRWTDAAGQVHQSAPSSIATTQIGPLSVSPNSTACGSTILTIPTLRVTNKTGVLIDVWRTIANGSILYRVTYTANPIQNNPAVDSITYHDTTTDDSLTGSDLLYTIGSLPNVGPPGACTSIVTFQNRLALAGLDDEYLVVFSQAFQLNQGVMWNSGLSVRLDPFGGPVTALSVLDGNLLIFKKSQIWIVSGTGPDPLGNGAFSPPQFITGNVGCLGPSQVQVTQLGVVFVSEKGAYLIDRSLTVTYIGAPAEGLINDPNVTSVLSVEDSNRILFFTDAGYTVAWDYFIDPEDPSNWLGKWTTYTAQSGVAAINWQGSSVYSDAILGELLMENPGAYEDGATPFQFQFETGWIDETAKRQGFQRVWRLIIQGLFQVGQAIQVLIQYDDDTSYSDTVVWTPAEMGNGNYYGGQYYGAGTYGGQTASPPPITQGQINIPRHRCSRVKFNISELTPSNQPLSVTSLALEIATEQGGNRVGFSNVAG